MAKYPNGSTPRKTCLCAISTFHRCGNYKGCKIRLHSLRRVGESAWETTISRNQALLTSSGRTAPRNRERCGRKNSGDSCEVARTAHSRFNLQMDRCEGIENRQRSGSGTDGTRTSTVLWEVLPTTKVPRGIPLVWRTRLQSRTRAPGGQKNWNA